MKKYISLLSFIALFFVGVNQSNAQEKVTSKERPEVTAKKVTHEMHNLLQLTGDQQRTIYKVFVEAENNKLALAESESNITTIQKSKTAISDYVNSRLKDILTPEQYTIYMKSKVK